MLGPISICLTNLKFGLLYIISVSNVRVCLQVNQNRNSHTIITQKLKGKKISPIFIGVENAGLQITTRRDFPANVTSDTLHRKPTCAFDLPSHKKFTCGNTQTPIVKRASDADQYSWLRPSEISFPHSCQSTEVSCFTKLSM